MAIDQEKMLRRMIKQEIDKPVPTFSLLSTYQGALRELISRKRLTLQEGDEDSGVPPYYVDPLDTNLVTNRRDFVRMTRNGRPLTEAYEDNALIAMSRMASQRGFDPLAAVINALPTIEALYEGAERENIRQMIRQEVEKRLRDANPDVVQVVHPNPPIEGQPLQIAASNP